MEIERGKGREKREKKRKGMRRGADKKEAVGCVFFVTKRSDSTGRTGAEDP